MQLLGLGYQISYDAPAFKLGMRAERSEDAAEFIFVELSAPVTSIGQALQVRADARATPLTTANALIGSLVATAQITAPAGSFIWALLIGRGSTYVAANCAANAVLYTTDIPGLLTDAGNDDALPINNLTTSLANGATARAIVSYANVPTVGQLSVRVVAGGGTGAMGSGGALALVGSFEVNVVATNDDIYLDMGFDWPTDALSGGL